MGFWVLLNVNIFLVVIYVLVWVSLLDFFRRVVFRVEEKSEYKVFSSFEVEGSEDKIWLMRIGRGVLVVVSIIFFRVWEYLGYENFVCRGYEEKSFFKDLVILVLGYG